MHFSRVQSALNTLLKAADSNGILELDSGRPGPVAAITALTHGNEISGILTAEHIVAGIQSGVWRLAAGKLQVFLANYEILRDATGFEELTRHRGLDLNRIWGADRQPVADDQPGSNEFGIRERLLPWLSKADYLIDLHSTSLKSTPIGILLTDSPGTLDRVCEVLDVPYVLPNIGQYLTGTAMIERHHEFVSDRLDKKQSGSSASFSLVIEAGQHFDFSTVDRNVDNVAALLQMVDVLDGAPRQLSNQALRLNTYFVGLAESAGNVIEWVYTDAPAGFDFIAGGTHVCNLHGQPVYAENDSYVVMPQLQARNPGQELFYLTAPF
ncbi:MAG: succinylglutamate desuccinylase/aspartoacylase family protein [Burkholderiaceae bacterium]